MNQPLDDIDPNSTRRKRFTEQEDARLKSLVKREGIKNWEEIARRMPGRSSRQCRDRYNNYLFKEILHKPWTPEEDKIIMEKYLLFGPHWVKISQFLEARSGNNVKNRCHKYLVKNLAQPQEVMNPQAQPIPQQPLVPVPQIPHPIPQMQQLQPQIFTPQPVYPLSFPLLPNDPDATNKVLDTSPQKLPGIIQLPPVSLKNEKQKQPVKLPSIGPLISQSFSPVNKIVPKELQFSSLLI